MYQAMYCAIKGEKASVVCLEIYSGHFDDNDIIFCVLVLSVQHVFHTYYDESNNKNIL